MDVNEAACRVLDYEREELRKLTPSVLCKSLDWTEFGSRLIKDQAAKFEAELSCKNGALFMCEVHARLVSMPGDLAVLLVCRETGHAVKKRGGDEDSENNYRSMFEHALEGIYQTTTDGSLVKANPALARILGYDSVEEMISSASTLHRGSMCAPSSGLICCIALKPTGIMPIRNSRFSAATAPPSGCVTTRAPSRMPTAIFHFMPAPCRTSPGASARKKRWYGPRKNTAPWST